MEEIVCILCPRGCILKIKSDNKKLISVNGNECKKGIGYAKEEIEYPKRNISSTIPIEGNQHIKSIPVKTSESIPKEYIFLVMDEIKKIKLFAPIESGKIIIKNVCGLDCDIIATRTIKKN